MRTTLLACLIFAFSSPAIFAQTDHRCGLSPADAAKIQARHLRLKSAQPAAGDRNVRYVPVRFHLVGDANGQGRLPERRALALLCQLNKDFESVGMQFFLAEKNGSFFDKSIANDLVFNTGGINTDGDKTAEIIMEAARDPNAINIFIVKEIPALPGGILFGTVVFENDWIVLSKSSFPLDDVPVISHEMGHFFSLLHTYHGWGEKLFDQSFPGWPVAPASINGHPVELMDGSNCDVAGDLICDTPPDYLFCVFSNACSYSGGAQDPNGVPVDPMENNMMSCFSGCSDYVFTSKQAEHILADLDSPERDYLDNTFQPAATNVAPPPGFLVAPPPNFKFDTFNMVKLDWEPVAGATHYLVEVDLAPNFSTSYLQTWLTTDDFLEITTLQPLKNYRWRVLPFNANAACTDAAMQVIGSFQTGAKTSGTPTMSFQNSVTIGPNPGHRGDAMRLFFDFTEPADFDIELADAQGKVLRRSQTRQRFGYLQLDPSFSDVSAGVYFLRVRSERFQSVLRVLRVD